MGRVRRRQRRRWLIRRPRARRRRLFQDAFLATTEIHDSAGDRILLVTHRAADEARADHAIPYFAGGENQHLFPVSLGALQHLGELDVHANRASCVVRRAWSSWPEL